MVTLAGLSVLTGISVCGTVWQWRRHHSAQTRWERINKLMETFTPLPLKDELHHMLA